MFILHQTFTGWPLLNQNILFLFFPFSEKCSRIWVRAHSHYSFNGWNYSHFYGLHLGQSFPFLVFSSGCHKIFWVLTYASFIADVLWFLIVSFKLHHFFITFKWYLEVFVQTGHIHIKCCFFWCLTNFLLCTSSYLMMWMTNWMPNIICTVGSLQLKIVTSILTFFLEAISLSTPSTPWNSLWHLIL